MKKNLVLAGGGHAHLMSLANLRQFVKRGVAVSVIGASAHHYYSGMGPGMLGGMYRPEEIRFETERCVTEGGGTFIQGEITRIDPIDKRVFLASGDSVPYDLISCNIGSRVPIDMVAKGARDIFPVKPIEGLRHARDRILELGSRKKPVIGIVGAGPSAVEIAGNLHRLTRSPGRKPADVVLYSRRGILPNHPDRLRAKVLASLQRRGIEIRSGCNIRRIDTGSITEASGETHAADIIFIAVGVKPSPVFAASGIPTGPDGGLRVNRYLQSVAYRDIFGGGDCIFFEPSPLGKVGVYAVRQNPVLLHNLTATLDSGKLQPFHPGGDYLLIFNLGDGTGLFHRGRMLFNGRLALIVKRWIDRRFMRRFQEPNR